MGFVANLLPQEKVVMHQPPGTGKTRSILSFVYLYAQQHANSKIVVRFPSQALKNQDALAYSMLRCILPQGTTLMLEVGPQRHRQRDYV